MLVRPRSLIGSRFIGRLMSDRLSYAHVRPRASAENSSGERCLPNREKRASAGGADESHSSSARVLGALSLLGDKGSSATTLCRGVHLERSDRPERRAIGRPCLGTGAQVANDLVRGRISGKAATTIAAELPSRAAGCGQREPRDQSRGS